MKKYIFTLALLIVGALSGPMTATATGLAVPVELDGYAWSSTIGWISFNCDQRTMGGPNLCATSNYKVQINPDGSMSGYAWASNGVDSLGNPTGVGWIRFGGLAGFPTGAGVASQNAEAVGSHPNVALTGWARACSGAANPATCSGGMASNSGGWDGWIALAGTGYNISFTNGVADNNADSYAWGGPNTMGWIDFSPEDAGGNPLGPVTLRPVVDIEILGINSTPGTVDIDGIYDSVAFLANVEGIPNGDVVDYTLSLGASSQTGTVTGTASGPSFSPNPVLLNVPYVSSDMLTLQVDMPEPGAVQEINETNLYTTALTLPIPPPTVTITGPDVVRAGDTAEIDWSISAPYTVTCRFQGPGVDETVTLIGVVGAAASDNGTVTSSALTNNSRFEISCDVGSDTYVTVYQVEVIPTFQEI